MIFNSCDLSRTRWINFNPSLRFGLPYNWPFLDYQFAVGF